MRKAKAHVDRDRGRGNAAATRAVYKEAIHAAVLLSRGRDAYTGKAPDNAKLKELAAHAIRLAKLDTILRARVLDPLFETANEEDVEDLVAMLSVVPFDDLLSKDTLLLNPTFGNSSREVAGADADLISGDRLIDFKVTMKAAMEPKWLDQLLGYFLLWRKERRKAPALPEIRKAGFLFARHGYLWTFDGELSVPVSAFYSGPSPPRNQLHLRAYSRGE